LFLFDTTVRINCFWILFQKTSDFIDVVFLTLAAFHNLRLLLTIVNLLGAVLAPTPRYFPHS